MPSAQIGGYAITVTSEGALSEYEQELIYVPKANIHAVVTTDQGIFLQTGSAKIPFMVWKFKPAPVKRAFEFLIKHLFGKSEETNFRDLLEMEPNLTVS